MRRDLLVLVEDQERPLVWIAPPPMLVLRLSWWHDDHEHHVGYDIDRDLVQAIRAWWRLRNGGARPRLSIARPR